MDDQAVISCFALQIPDHLCHVGSAPSNEKDVVGKTEVRKWVCLLIYDHPIVTALALGVQEAPPGLEPSENRFHDCHEQKSTDGVSLLDSPALMKILEAVFMHILHVVFMHILNALFMHILHAVFMHISHIVFMHY